MTSDQPPTNEDDKRLATLLREFMRRVPTDYEASDGELLSAFKAAQDAYIRLKEIELCPTSSSPR